MLILTLFSSELDACHILTKQSFSKRVHHGQIVTGTASDQQVKRTPFGQLVGSRGVVSGWKMSYFLKENNTPSKNTHPQ